MNRDETLNTMDEKLVLFGTFFAFSNRLQAAGDTFYEEITCKQFFLLICLSLFGDEPPTINELSNVMGSSHQNVKQIADKLEKAGFLETFQDRQDKRKLRVRATQKVKNLSQKYEEREEEFFEIFYKGITQEEIKEMLRLLMKLERNLENFREKKR